MMAVSLTLLRERFSDLIGTSQMLPVTDFVSSRISSTRKGDVAEEDALLHFSTFFPLHYSFLLGLPLLSVL